MNTLLTLSVRRKRDLLSARLRLRQVAHLLGFDPLEQAKIVCVGFELACRERDERNATAMTIAVDGRLLRVWLHHPEKTSAPNLSDDSVPQLSVAIPVGEIRLAPDDLAWAIEQLLQSGEPNLFEELRQHNQDLLCALTLLQQAHEDAPRESKTGRPFAA